MKECPVCSAKFDKKTKFCSKLCCSLGHRRRNTGKTCFKKGLIPWNKGKKYTSKKWTEDQRKSISGEKSKLWKKIKLFCLQCSSEYLLAPCLAKRSKFCSMKCVAANRLHGEKHWNWKGGATERSKLERTLKSYKEWRTAVFKRDNFTCQICNQKCRRVQADHIKPFSLFPELRLSVDNGRTLCEECHKDTETYGGKLRSYAKKNSTNPSYA